MPHMRLSPNRIFIFFILATVFAVNRWIGEPVLMRQFASDSLGGPLLAEEGVLVELQSGYDVVSPSNQVPPDTSSDDPTVYFSDTVGGMANPSNEALEWVPENAEVRVHTVVESETISSIAQAYGVSTETIMWANGLTSSSVIKPGDKLEFPSISGVLHKVVEGDTISGIASRYGVSQDRIFAANTDISAESLREGMGLIIPGARPQTLSVERPSYSPPRSIAESNINTLGYFRAPTVGLNWGRRHYNNAVDIANACGTPVWAAADGVVTWTGWNGDYGNLIKVVHPNCTETGYAHLSRIYVSVGAPVSQGDVIGLIGNTGRVRGVTGCHVHFEVVGGANPFIRYR